MGKRLSWVLGIFTLLLGIGGVWFAYEHYFRLPFALSESAKQEPWFVQSGLRMLTLRKNVPTVDRVVLVPDSATFLVAIQQWNLQGRWPILIEDQQYTPLFLQRFKAAEVIRLPAVKTPLPKGQDLRQTMLKAVASAWEATDPASLKEQWQQLGWEPPGAVLTWEKDPAWPAAVALAADRGQPLLFVEGDFGKPNDTLNNSQWQKLQFAVQQAVDQAGYNYALLGDSIDTITMVRQLAVKYQSPQKSDEQLAVTDGLGRFPNRDRWAIAGWIYGSPAHAVYQAMCSIFLDTENVLLYDSYPQEGSWKDYGMNSAANDLKEMGLNITLVQQPEASREGWRSLTSVEWDFDLILMNSKGMKDSFFVGGGDLSVKDIPKLNIPVAIHFLHSWSATAPDQKDTIAGKLLNEGAYVYVGSVHEPYLSAFVPAKLLAERLSQFTPFLIASRQFNAPPWKVTTIGDPLMMVMKPRQRISPKERPLLP